MWKKQIIGKQMKNKKKLLNNLMKFKGLLRRLAMIEQNRFRYSLLSVLVLENNALLSV